MTTLPVITAAFTPAATTTSTASSASSANSNTTASATATANSTTTAKSSTDNTASTTDTSNNSDSPQGFAALLASQVNPQSSLDTSKTLAKISSQILAKGQAVNKTTLTQAIAAGQSDGTLQLDDAQMSQLISAVNKLSAGTQSNPVLDTTALKSSLLTDKTDSKDDKASDATTLPVQALFAMLAAQPAQTTAATAPASSAQLTDTAELSNKAATTAVGLSTTAASLLSANDKTTGVTTSTVSDGKTDTAKPKTAATYSAQTVDNTSAALAASQVSAAATNAGASQDNAQSSQDGSAALQALAQSQSAASAVSTPVTQSLPTTSTTVTAPAVSALNAQLGSPEWQQALGQQVMMFSSQGKQTAELRLHPQDLGSIQISLKIEDNQAQIHFVSGHSQVRAAIESAMPELRTALADNGISLGQSSVGSDASQWQQANQQAGQQSSANQGSSASWAAFNSGGSVGSALPVSAAIQSLASGNSAVDIFA
jgi:flagellar hook-length control protein FliK